MEVLPGLLCSESPVNEDEAEFEPVLPSLTKPVIPQPASPQIQQRLPTLLTDAVAKTPSLQEKPLSAAGCGNSPQLVPQIGSLRSGERQDVTPEGLIASSEKGQAWLHGSAFRFSSMLLIRERF